MTNVMTSRTISKRAKTKSRPKRRAKTKRRGAEVSGDGFVPVRGEVPSAPAGAKGGPPIVTEAVRGAMVLGAFALVIRFGGDLPVTAVALPILGVTLVMLVGHMVVEYRARRRWTLH